MISKDSRIGEVIVKKGEDAGKLMDDTFCGNEGGKVCCQKTSVTLEFAASLTGKLDILPELLKQLHALPDIKVGDKVLP